jgi:predicted dehydrogenase
MQRFVDCVLNDTQPIETGEDGRAVVEALLATYESAGTGRKVTWLWEASRDRRPQEVWGS